MITFHAHPVPPVPDATAEVAPWRLELTDPGFDHTLLHDFRDRILVHQAEQQLFDTVLAAFKARGLLRAGGRQRTDATHVLANVRTLNRIECVGETLRHTLEVLATVAPAWLQPRIAPESMRPTSRRR